MNFIRCFILTAVLSAFVLFASGQHRKIDSLAKNIDSVRTQLPVEKLYLQLDKPAYLQNDTLWFKAYLLDADYLGPSPRSGLLYVELDDINNHSVKRMLAPVVSGLSWGNIALDERIPEGNYTLRAYTNWMRNFGEDYIFEQHIYIASAAGQPRLVTASFTQSKLAGKDHIMADIQVSNLDKQPVRLKDMELQVMNASHTLLKSKASTGVDGKLAVNFDVPENTDIKNLSIIARDITSGTEKASDLFIPVTLNRPEKTDLQFMPEGGRLVAGIPSKIGFKAIGENGSAVEVSGSVYDSKQQQVAVFKSAHKGMGAFELVPQANETYTAKLVLPEGSLKNFSLPTVSASGTAIRVDNNAAGDSLRVRINIPPDLLTRGAKYNLVGQSRGVVYYGAQLMLKKSPLTLMVPKSLFPTGIARFTLLTNKNEPLNERICFIDHHDNMQISMTASKKSYAPHDSIAVQIQVADSAGKPVRGNFSMAVTDDNQVKQDSTVGNIVSDMLLTSDLKGTVEGPAYYFENNSAERAGELDNLMLTQGWIGYEWKQIANPTIKPVYRAENGFTIQGTVTNVFNKPVAHTGVILMSKKPSFVIDTLTDTNGRFSFGGFMPLDTASFVVQAKNRRGKNFNIGIKVDEFMPPVFTRINENNTPWYITGDTTWLHSLNNSLRKQQADLKLTGARVLKGAVITGTKIIKGSKNLNGPGGADEVLDEKDMEKAGNMTLLQILQQKITGFTDEGQLYKLHQDTLFLIIDGINVDRFFSSDSPDSSRGERQAMGDRHEFLKFYLDNITTEDIVGIEAMYNFSKNIKYDIEFYSNLYAKSSTISHAYIEVTTRSGAGAFISKTPGVAVYKPLAVTTPRQFYRPKYTVKDKAPVLPDLRSTIHWEPNIITDAAGKATISFYSADSPTNYSIIINGTDLNGRVGYGRGKVDVRTTP